MLARGKSKTLRMQKSRTRIKPGAKAGFDSIKNPALRENIKPMLFSADWANRRAAISRLDNKIGRRQLKPWEKVQLGAALKSALFDSRADVRRDASKLLAKIIGLRSVVEFINKRYPGNALSKVPAEFFFWDSFSTETLLRLRKLGYPTVRELQKLLNEYGTPAFYHRGFPVFLKGIGDLYSYNLYGAIFVEKNVKNLPKQFRHSVAEHEFGENFSHNIGNALEMLWLERHGLFQQYLKKLPSLGKDFLKVIKEDPKGFAEFKKYFPELK